MQAHGVYLIKHIFDWRVNMTNPRKVECKMEEPSSRTSSIASTIRYKTIHHEGKTMTDKDTSITDLFPIPSSPPSTLVPKRWPGITPESTDALREVLKDNHTRWHIFFNDSGFHNHIAHRAIANWALGAAGDLLKAGYEADSSYQRPAFGPPEQITIKNFKEHLGDRQFYQGYLAFFTDVIHEDGIAAAVEKYIFSKDVNIVPSPTGKKPDVFNRFLGGLLHPMIHIGYGLEFCLPGIVAEGLAEAAVHADSSIARLPDGFIDYANAGKSTDDTVSRFKSLLHVSPPSTKVTEEHGTHVFTVLERVLNDPELGKIEDTESGMFDYTMKNHASRIAKHIADWQVDATNPRKVERKIQELSWMNAILFGIGGWSKDRPFNADFFHMHLVTSSIFLASFVAYLKPSSQENLLRGYLLVSIGWWVSRGRPALSISDFYASTSPYPLPSGPLPNPNNDSLKAKDPTKAVTPNPWLPIIETSVVHPDDHLPKLQRALGHYASLYGTREAGEPDFVGTELKGAEKLDGTLFIRASGLAAERLGRVREEGKAGSWDRNGFYEGRNKL
ncbi:hypothetical protein H0H87_011634 [Tephrocybe sp. NHM501043]|nr:hypothetical protein H0H87_011634 [Tephrocybe sp. NHM501043]